MRTTLHEQLLATDVEDVRSLFASAQGELVPLDGSLPPEDFGSGSMDLLEDRSFVLAIDEAHSDIIGAIAYVSREEAAYVEAVAVREGEDHDATVGAMIRRLESFLVSEAGRSTICIGVWSNHAQMRHLVTRLGFSLFSFDLDCASEGVDAMVFHRRSTADAPREALTTH